MKVAIRTDASSLIGTGHVIRCKTLADELRRRGADIRFICRRQSGNLIDLLQNAGYSVVRLPSVEEAGAAPLSCDNYADWLGVEQPVDAAQTIEALDGFVPEWLVVDHYGLDMTWENLLRPHARRIFAIDDLANRRHDCDLLLDSSCFGGEVEDKYSELVPRTCKLLLGPRYALLQPVFSELRQCLPAREGRVQRVLLFLGGVDQKNQTVKALQALRAPVFRHIAVDVVIGAANPHRQELEQLISMCSGASLHRQMPNLAGLMARADLMLGAGGTTTWERCCLGLPSIVVIASENQRHATSALADLGVHLSLGLAAEVESQDWADALLEALESPEKVRTYAQAASAITDGLGTLRIAAMMDQKPAEIKMRHTTSSDESLLLTWANDPGVRSSAFSPKPIASDAHHTWFSGKLADSNCMLLIGEDIHGLPVGQVRFDRHGGEALIDISVDPPLRGRGIGEQLLRKAISKFWLEGCREPVVGEVLPENRASRRMFERAGFKLSSSSPGRPDCPRFVLSAN